MLNIWKYFNLKKEKKAMASYARYYDFDRVVDRYKMARNIFWLLLVIVVAYFISRDGESFDGRTKPHYGKVVIDMESMVNHKYLKALNSANDNPLCQGVLVVFDHMIGSDGMGNTQDALASIKSLAKNKKVVSYLFGYTMGNDYVVATGANKIVAQETAAIGGISYRTVMLNYDKLLNRLGIDVVSKGFGDFKVEPEKGSVYYDAFKKHRNEIADQLQDWLVDQVIENRALSRDSIEKINKGQWYLAIRGIDINLVDHLGDEHTAVEVLKELTGQKDIDIHTYVPDSDDKKWWQVLFEVLFSNPSDTDGKWFENWYWDWVINKVKTRLISESVVGGRVFQWR